MSIPFAPSRSPAHRLALAVCLITTTMAIVYGTTAAVAADMSMPTKAEPAPAYQWSGCYVGGNAGYGGPGVNFSTTVIPFTYLDATDSGWVNTSGGGSRNQTDFVGGGHVGCNWQTGTLVLGLEGDFDWLHSNPNYTNNTNTLIDRAGVPFAIGQSLTTNYLTTVRPRIGIAADRNLAYITGGVAFTNANYSETYSDGNGATGFASTSKSLVGWAAGAGWEYAFTDSWTFRAEYLIAGFTGSLAAAGTITGPGGTSNPLQGSASSIFIQVGRAGVEFKF